MSLHRKVKLFPALGPLGKGEEPKKMRQERCHQLCALLAATPSSGSFSWSLGLFLPASTFFCVELDKQGQQNDHPSSC